MQEVQVFEYAVIRVVPKVERDEFLNVGVLVYCAKHKFLRILYHLDEERFRIFGSTVDLEELAAYLKAFESICAGVPQGGAIGAFTLPDRFRWLTAVRSTILQTSRVHLGFCADPERKLKDLFNQLVLI